MKLDPKGLEAAREQPGTNHDGIIRAYLTAITPAEVGGLVERLREGTFGSDITKTDAYLNGLMREAATALAAKDAELKRKDMQLEASAKVALDLSAQLAEARKALEFYADLSKYPAPLTGGMGALWSDCGRIARRALTGGHEE